MVGSPVSREGPPVASVVAQAAVSAAAETKKLLTQLDGSFVALHFERAAGRVTVVTDPLGLQPAYRADGPRRVVVASTAAGAALAAGRRFREDPGATGTLLVLGHLLGSRTIHRDVSRIAPASVLQVEAGSARRETLTSYWRVPVGEPDNAPLEVHLDGVLEELRRWLDATLGEHEPGTFLLSGGFDSRLALGLLLERGIRPQLLSIRHRDENGDADFRIARKLARRLGAGLEAVDPPPDFFDSPAYQEYVRRTEGATASLFLFISTLVLARKTVGGAAWDGLLPGFLNVAPYEMEGFDPYLARLVRPRLDRLEASGVFHPDWLAATLEAFRDLVQEERDGWPDTPAGVLGFGLRNRVRLRFGLNPVCVLGSRAPVHLPGSTRAFWERVARVPVAQRAGGRFHLELLRRLVPDLLRVPFASGTRLVAGAGSAAPELAVRRGLAACHGAVARRPRLQALLRRARLPVPFRWQGSASALGLLAAATRSPHVYSLEVVEARLKEDSALDPSEERFLPLVTREGAIACVTGRGAGGTWVEGS